jgi:predicted ATPase/DNA-binding XRE family transcriptional regulator
MHDIISFGRWLKLRRIALYLTQEGLAQLAGCSAIAIRKIESDERLPSLRLAEKLARHLELAPDEQALFMRAARSELGAVRLPTPTPPALSAVAPAICHDALPVPPTPLIGREQLVAQVAACMLRRDVRLLTLTGPGGVGKTRVALQAAAELSVAFADSACLVSLAPLGNPALVMHAIASALGLQEAGGGPLLGTVVRYLRGRQLLLLLDNFEHLLAAAPVAAQLLAGASQLKLLVTSRSPLHLRGENEIVVPPLALPPHELGLTERATMPGSACSVQSSVPELTQYAAVQLFIQRALNVQADFALTNANAPTVAEICHRLDGLPLAIELAVARLKIFAPEGLLARLGSQLALLTSGPRDLPARQQTMRSTIAWSYHLLEGGVQALFAQLGVFVGGCTLEAAESICHADGRVSLDVVDRLSVLVDTSLVGRVSAGDHKPRFVMLEMIREYALECLVARGEADTVRRQHAEYYLALAETAQPWLRGAQWIVWLDRIEVEHDNLRAALAWALGGRDVELGCRAVVALDEFWSARAYWNEGWRWREMALEQSGAVSPSTRAMLLLQAGINGWQHGDWEAARRRRDEALALFRAVGDQSGIAACLHAQGMWAGDPADAVQLYEASLALYRELGDRRGVALVLHHLGDLVRDQGDLARGVVLLEASLALHRELEDSVEASKDLNGLGDVACCQGNYQQAIALYWEAIAVLEPAGHRWGLLWPLRNLGWMTLLMGDDGRVQAVLQEYISWSRNKAAIASLRELTPLLGVFASRQGDAAQATALLREGVMWQQWYRDTVEDLLLAFAWVAAGQGQPERAICLLGAITNMSLGSTLQAASDHLIATLRPQFDCATIAAAWKAGQVLTLEQAMSEALAVIEPAEAIGRQVGSYS